MLCLIIIFTFLGIKCMYIWLQQHHYFDEIPFNIHQNPDSQTVLRVEGQGSEPHLVFNQHLLQFPTVLPLAAGSEAEVLIFNPMPYPVEMYSLEFDKQYLEEEEVCM